MNAILITLLLLVGSADRIEETHLRATARCPMWHRDAIRAGWTVGDLPTLDRVMWRESRCLPGAVNGGDPHGGSIGLMQINRFWCLPSRWYPTGYLQARGVLASCDELAMPAVNLRAARVVFEYAAGAYGDGWGPWEG
jgi:hypothetical protein